MNLPIENYLAFFPATITVEMGWFRRPVRLGPLTIGRAVLLDALGVDVRQPISDADTAIVAYVLKGEAASRRFNENEKSFKSFSRRVKRHLKPLTKAVNAICTDAFTTYVKPPKSTNNRISDTKTGAGWALDFAEALCADYGWSWQEAINTPLSTVFALSAAYLDRHDLRPSCMDYEQRKAAKERKRNG